MVTAEGVRILEMTCRLSGGFGCEYLVPAATGQEIVKAALLQSIGRDIDLDLLRPKRLGFGVSYNVLAEPGVVVSVDGVEDARASRGVKHVFLRHRVGDRVPEHRDCAARSAWVIAVGHTPTAAWANAEEAAGKIRIETVQEGDA
jgi:biotin carboxylase